MPGIDRTVEVGLRPEGADVARREGRLNHRPPTPPHSQVLKTLAGGRTLALREKEQTCPWGWHRVDVGEGAEGQLQKRPPLP